MTCSYKLLGCKFKQICKQISYTCVSGRLFAGDLRNKQRWSCDLGSWLRPPGAWVSCSPPAPAPAPAVAKGEEGAALTDRWCRPQAQICSAYALGLDTKNSCYLTWSFNCSVLRSVVAVNVTSTRSKLGTWEPFTTHVSGLRRQSEAVHGSRAEQT